MSPSNSPCAACKLQRRKCTQECVFAPYFPPDQPQKFENVHKVFGASNVAKLLNELNANQREDAVNSLAYEADARLRDPVYGCVGLISILQHKLKEVQSDLYNAKKELANYLGPQNLPQILQPPTYMPQTHPGASSSSVLPYNMSHMMGIPTGPSPSGQLVICEPYQQQHQTQQIFEAQQMAAAVAAREQQEMFRTSFEQKQALHQHQQQQQQPQQPQDLLRFNSGFDPASGSVTATGFNQMTAAAMSPSLALGNFDLPYHMQQPQQPEHHNPHHAQLRAQILLPPQEPQLQQQPQQTQQSQQHQTDQGEEGRGIGPSC